MRRMLVGVVAWLALAGACGSGAGTGGAAGTTGSAGSSGTAGGTGGGGVGGNHMTMDGLMGAGNTPGSGSGGQAAPGLLGNWVYAGGTATRTCPGEPPNVAPAEGGISVAAGAGDELVVTEACALRFKLSGKVATIVAGQTCSGDDGAGGQVRFEMVTWTLTLAADGLSLNETLTADEILTPASGPSRKCSYVESGVTLRRP